MIASRSKGEGHGKWKGPPKGAAKSKGSKKGKAKGLRKGTHARWFALALVVLSLGPTGAESTEVLSEGYQRRVAAQVSQELVVPASTGSELDTENVRNQRELEWENTRLQNGQQELGVAAGGRCR